MFWDRTIYSCTRSLPMSQEYHGKIHSANKRQDRVNDLIIIPCKIIECEETCE
jgi:hypothetical protein